MRLLPSATAVLILLFSSSIAIGQSFVPDLNGFRLRQTRDVTHKELGEPDKADTNEEGIYYEAFLISETPLLYMIFQYRDPDPEIIWSIQITGENDKHELHFRGLRMGQSPAEVEKILGKPTKKINVGEHGTRWEYDRANYSVEINPTNRLSSIRIVHDREAKPDTKKLPKFADLAKKLASGTNAELAELVSPDVEIYGGNKTVAFQYAMKKEIESDSSGVFSGIRRLAKELADVDPTKSDQYEELARLRQNRDPIHVAKFWKLKGITEIAYIWDGERWAIWELGAKPQTAGPADWRSIYKPGTLKELVEVRMQDLIKNPNVLMTKDNNKDKPIVSLSYNSYPARATVKYTGERRKTPETVIGHIGIWLTVLGKPKDLASRFEWEYKLIESGTEYWLPVQNPPSERLAREVKPNDEITIYLSWLGINYDSGKPQLLAIVNEFEALPK